MQFKSTVTQSRVRKYNNNRFLWSSYLFYRNTHSGFPKRDEILFVDLESRFVYIIRPEYILPISGLYKTLEPLEHQGLGLDCNPKVFYCSTSHAVEEIRVRWKVALRNYLWYHKTFAYEIRINKLYFCRNSLYS